MALRRARAFRRRDDRIEVGLDGAVRAELRRAGELVLALVDAGEDPVLPARVAPAIPDDLAVARLFPSAYADADAAAEFRRLTDGELRAGKRADAIRLRDSADDASLGESDAEAWLRAVNDARLVLASRLGVETDEDSDRMYAELDSGAGPARATLIVAYLNLGLVQEELIAALDG